MNVKRIIPVVVCVVCMLVGGIVLVQGARGLSSTPVRASKDGVLGSSHDAEFYPASASQRQAAISAVVDEIAPSLPSSKARDPNLSRYVPFAPPFPYRDPYILKRYPELGRYKSAHYGKAVISSDGRLLVLASDVPVQGAKPSRFIYFMVATYGRYQVTHILGPNSSGPNFDRYRLFDRLTSQ